jgi:tyrosinase
LFALFEATHPTWWLPAAGFKDGGGTYTIAPGTIEYSNTSLTPFSQSADGTQWDSNGSRGLAPFGYSYPEIEDWHQTPSQLASNVTAQINALYNPSGTKSRRGVSLDTSTQEWFVNIAVDKCALDKSFTVNIFLGNPPADPVAWKTAPNFVSLIVVFRPIGNACVENMKTYGEIPLKKALENAGLANASPATVADLLTKDLHWRIQEVCALPSFLSFDTGEYRGVVSFH